MKKILLLLLIPVINNAFGSSITLINSTPYESLKFIGHVSPSVNEISFFKKIIDKGDAVTFSHTNLINFWIHTVAEKSHYIHGSGLNMRIPVASSVRITVKGDATYNVTIDPKNPKELVVTKTEYST